MMTDMWNMMAGMWIWMIGGILAVVVLVVLIAKQLRK